MAVVLFFLVSPFVIAETRLEVNSLYVKVGDLFSSAESNLKDKIILKSPALGKEYTLTPAHLATLAERVGITLASQKSIAVHRKSHVITEEELVQKMNLPAHMGLKLNQFSPLHCLPGQQIEVDQVHLDEEKKTLTARLSFPEEDNQMTEVQISGKLQPLQEVPMLNRLLKPGDPIQQRDLIWRSIPVERLNQNYALRESDVVGLSPRQTLQPFQPIQLQDIEKPIVVKKGDMVNIRYTTKRVKLTLKAMAQDKGAIGDTVPFEGYDKKKTIRAVITSAGEAVIT